MVLAVVVLRADSPASALAARAQLGEGIWSRTVRIENRSDDGRYPARLHALVFEFDGRLWFYTDMDGTQSFSLHAAGAWLRGNGSMATLRPADRGE